MIAGEGSAIAPINDRIVAEDLSSLASHCMSASIGEAEEELTAIRCTGHPRSRIIIPANLKLSNIEIPPVILFA